MQHLEALKGKFPEPLLNHTFGASVRGVDMIANGATALKSAKPARRWQLSVCVLAQRAEAAEAWRKDIEKLEAAAAGLEQSRQTTAEWWRNFWNRNQTR